MVEILDQLSNVFPSHRLLTYIHLVLDVKQYFTESVGPVDGGKVEDLLR